MIIDLLIENIKFPTDEDLFTANDFVDELETNMLLEQDTALEFWCDKFSHPDLFNAILYMLASNKLIECDVRNNYGYVRLLGELDRENIISLKTRKYALRFNSRYTHNLVKRNEKYVRSGLVRHGFAKIYKNKFSYDKTRLASNLQNIANNLLDGYTTSSKAITYEYMVCDLLAVLANNDNKFSTENNIIDSRGRSIFQCQKRVFNPISSKDARALLEIPSITITLQDIPSINAIFAFCGELAGLKGIGLTYLEKCDTGKTVYSDRHIPESCELHEKIWLERMFEKLDILYATGSVDWNIPIEVDASASMLQYIGLLMNDHVYLKMTNLLGNTYDDIWSIDGVTRQQVKTVMTQTLYGSSRSPKQILDEEGIEYTKHQLLLLQKLVGAGSIFHNALFLRDYIINNVNPSNIMDITIGSDRFTIECNKKKWGITEPKIYTFFSSKSKGFKRMFRNRCLEPDLIRFKRYFQTLFIHNLDSQVANRVCEKANYWIVPNHDAFLIHPKYAPITKKLYVDSIYDLYKHRKTVLSNYLTCLGIEPIDINVSEKELTRSDFNDDTALK